MKYRKLRIAWSVAWGIACLLLVVLWVRDYEHAWPRITAIIDNYPAHPVLRRLDEPPPPLPPRKIDVVYKSWFEFTFTSIPYLALVLGLLVSSTIPWLRFLPRRFSLRTLLVGMTVAAIGLGLAVYILRQ